MARQMQHGEFLHGLCVIVPMLHGVVFQWQIQLIPHERDVSLNRLGGHPDQPEWLDHVNASVLKVKLGTAIIGISSIHLLKTFINAANYDEKVLMWQTIIHMAFLLSAIAIAYADRLMSHHDKSSH